MKYICLLLVAISVSSWSAERHVTGEVTDLTSIPNGLLIRVNGNEKPTLCVQESAWLLIPEENKTMVSVALANFMAGNKKATIYINPEIKTGYCTLNQYDPT